MERVPASHRCRSLCQSRLRCSGLVVYPVGVQEAVVRNGAIEGRRAKGCGDTRDEDASRRTA